MAGMLKNKPIIVFDEKAVGKRIAILRQAKGLTQKMLAEKIGIKRALVSDYERGKVRIYGDMIARIAIVLKVSSDDILGLKLKSFDKQMPSLKIMKRVRQITELPAAKQKIILRNIDINLSGLN